MSDRDAHRNLTWDALCRPAGSGLSCSLSDTDGYDRTSNAGWTVAGPATVTGPGRVETTGYGEIFVSASYVDYVGGPFMTRQVAHFLADPPRAARRFHFLGGYVWESSGKQGIPDASVSILDGYNAGRSDATNTDGYYTIDSILTGEAFTVRVEKPGYETLTRSYRVDDPVGPLGNSPFLDLRLVRAPGS